MQYRILTDTVLPLSGAAFSPQTFAPVLPRLSPNAPLCPDIESYRLACRSGAFNIVLTAPAQLSGSYATARSAMRQAGCSRFRQPHIWRGAAFARLLCGRARKAGSLFREDSARYSGGAEICSLLFCRAGWKCGGSCGKPTAVRRPAVSFSRLYGGKRGGNPLLPHDIGPFSGRSAGRGGRLYLKRGMSAAIAHDRCEKRSKPPVLSFIRRMRQYSVR